MIDESRLGDAEVAQLRAEEGAKDRAAGQDYADTLSDGPHAIVLSLVPHAFEFQHHFRRIPASSRSGTFTD